MSDGGEVVVFPDKYTPGWNGEHEEFQQERLDRFDVMPLREALTTEWQTDAHFAGYVCPGMERQPRLNLSSLGWFQSHRPGQIPELRTVAVDLDFPEHGEDQQYGWENRGDWPPEMRRWWERVQRAHDQTPELQSAGMYLTRGGMRYVWPLAEERRVGVELGGSYLNQYLTYLEDRGLPLDFLDEWNRLFRLPFVVRDGVMQNRSMNIDSMEPLDWDPPDPLTQSTPSGVGTAAREEMPDPDSLDSVNLSDLTPFENCWFYRHLRNDLPLAEAGERHNTLLEIVGTICSILDTNDPLEPFQILRPCVEEMREDGNDYEPEWSEVWDICTWVSQTHDGMRQQREDEEQSFMDRQAEAMGCAPEEIQNRLVLVTKSPSTYYVWDEQDMEYQTPFTNQTMLLSELADCCPRASGIYWREESVSVPRLLQDYGTSVDAVTLDYSADYTRYDGNRERIVESTLQRDPNLRPVYDEEIDRWLRLLFADRAEKGLDWLATFLRLDRSTCAIYIDGPPSIGKGMLAEGLSRFWRASPVPYKELMEGFQPSLTESPLIVADEKVPEDPFRDRGSSIFREVVGTGSFRINRKHRPKVDLVGFPRVMITANNADALQIHEALGEADIEAIKRRIGFVDTDVAAREYLERLAAEKGVAVQDMTQAWVAGGGIAQHVLWLHENRDVEIGDRFLVEGWESDLTRNLAISFGAAPLMGKFLARTIRDKRNIRGVRYGEGSIYVNLDYVRQSWGTIMGESSRVPDDTALMKALKVLSEGERTRLRPDEGSERRYYWAIDSSKVAKIAEEYYVTDAETIHSVVQAEFGEDDRPERGIPLEVLNGSG